MCYLRAPQRRFFDRRCFPALIWSADMTLGSEFFEPLQDVFANQIGRAGPFSINEPPWFTEATQDIDSRYPMVLKFSAPIARQNEPSERKRERARNPDTTDYRLRARVGLLQVIQPVMPSVAFDSQEPE